MAAGLVTASTEIERQRLQVQTSISPTPLSHSVTIPDAGSAPPSSHLQEGRYGQPGQYRGWQSSGTFQLDDHWTYKRKSFVTWSPLTESNRRPSPYHGDALPTELRGRTAGPRAKVTAHARRAAAGERRPGTSAPAEHTRRPAASRTHTRPARGWQPAPRARPPIVDRSLQNGRIQPILPRMRRHPPNARAAQGTAHLTRNPVIGNAMDNSYRNSPRNRAGRVGHGVALRMLLGPAPEQISGPAAPGGQMGACGMPGEQ